MAAGMKEVSRETVIESKAKLQVLPKELEIQHMPPVGKYTDLLQKATDTFATPLSTERIKLDENAVVNLKKAAEPLKKAYPADYHLLQDKFAIMDSHLAKAKKTMSQEDYKKFYKEFATLSRSVSQLADAAYKEDKLKEKKLTYVKKMLDIVYTGSSFVIPPVMIAGRLTGAQEEKISKVDKAIIGLSFIPVVGPAVKVAKSVRGAEKITAAALKLAKESAFLANLAKKAKLAKAVEEASRYTGKAISAEEKFQDLTKTANIYVRDAARSAKQGNFGRAVLSAQEAERRANMTVDALKLEVERAVAAKDINKMGTAKDLLNKAQESLTKTKQFNNEIKDGYLQAARLKDDVKFLSEMGKSAKAARALEFKGMNSIDRVKSTFSSPKVLFEMMDRTLNSEKKAVVLKQVFNVSNIAELSKPQRAILDAYGSLNSTESLAGQLGKASEAYVKAGGTAAEAEKFRFGFMQWMSSERISFILDKIFDASEFSKLSKTQQVLVKEYQMIGKEADIASHVERAANKFIKAGGTLEEAQAFNSAFLSRLHAAGNNATKPFVSALGKGKDIPRLHEIAHDFRNTTTAVSPYSELLLETVEELSRVSGAM